MDRNTQEYKRSVAEAIYFKLLKGIEKQEKVKAEDRKLKAGGKICKVLVTSLVLLTQACSLADPAVGGYSGGADGYELSVPEKGSITRTVTITRNPEGDRVAGRMYNQSVYDSFTNWLTSPIINKGVK